MKTKPQMETAYNPEAIEASWYVRWEQGGLFRADADSAKPKFTMCFPPPNVTGELHMGHALQTAVYDLLARYKRMTGHEVLFLPGYDHAAIATQNVLEKQLAREGTSKEEIGREAFDELVERWYRDTGATIINQLRLLGASMDWSRLRFTMDQNYIRAVLTSFVRYYEKGWLYRGPRIVNWCPKNLSVISDLEVVWRAHQDQLFHIRYPIEGGGEVVIATVRPETMLADTGVAVNPADARYKDIVGKTAILPLVGRRLPVVADEAVEMEFGTGALKVTPGHDPMDYDIGQRHGLEIVNGMHLDGRMNVPGLPYDGLPALEARAAVVRDLEQQGYLVTTEPYTHEVGHCYRCDAIIEPLISEQWFLNMAQLSGQAIAAQEQGKLSWHPERWERTFLDWQRNLRDWCVSRQLWLGHRIPAYTCGNGHLTVTIEPPAACPRCGDTGLTQDPDVLDTWFSSALWPFATLGWPDDTEDLRVFYPTDVNCTARDIIWLWVSRMIMSGLEFMGDVPFRNELIHCTVHAAEGGRMSKSLGTGVDPREIIDRYGADALRAWSAQVAMSGQDVRFDESRIEGYRRYANKLWNATRLVTTAVGDETPPNPDPDGELQLVDRWILGRLQETVATATAGIDAFNFHTAIGAIYDFTWHELCDWYLEAVKPRLRDGDPAAKAVAVHCLDTSLRLLHPLMPFVTEELWHRLPGERDYLLHARWPEADERFVNAERDEAFERVRDYIESVRAYEGPSRTFTPSWSDDSTEGRLYSELAAGVRIRPKKVVEPASAEAECRRLRAELGSVQDRLANPDFRSRAPAEVVAKQEARAAELQAAIARLCP
ncbi:MAG TPA: valine--tRNA ligase [Candidatus Dormibacteraeota bacterium]